MSLIVREACNYCPTLAVLVCKFYTPVGPVYLCLCKTHIQKIGIVVDNLVQTAVFPASPPPSPSS